MTQFRAGTWRMIGALQFVVIVLLGAGLALAWQPAPHSDWAYYWTAAGDPSLYERGGLSLWLLAIPKALGLGPVPAALFLNLPSAALLLYLGYRVDSTVWRAFAQMLAAYLLLITPYLGIVQLDLVATAQLAFAFGVLLVPWSGRPRWMSYALALLAVTAAVSTRPQFALVLWALVGLGALAWVLFRKGRDVAFGRLLVVLLLGSLLGFAADSSLRQFSGRTDALRTSSAVTLYGGLLVSRIEGCGYWSVEAAEAARADMEKPLPAAIRDRLAAKPISHWWSILRCKWPQVLRPPPYALYWLVESPNIRHRIDARPDRAEVEAWYHRALAWESTLYGVLTALILLACAWTTVARWREWRMKAVLPSLWVVSFWVVHLIFEIQGRYFLGMFVLAPLIAAWAFGATRLREDTPSVTR